MFPLASTEFPTSREALTAAVRQALEARFELPRPEAAVQVSGEGFPALERVTIDLSGARVRAAEPPPRPAGPRRPGITVGDLRVEGHPIFYETSALDLALAARDVRLDAARDAGGKPLLVLTDAAEGRVEASVRVAELEAMLLRAAQELARPHKVTIQDLKLELTSPGERSVAAVVRLKARKLLVSGTIRLTGRLDVDEHLVGRVSDLKAAGEGVVGTLVAGVLQKHLQPQAERRIPLMAFSMGEVSLRDVRIAVTDRVRVHAAFGRRA